MISLQRLEANRRNALRSTGPRTEDGKQRSRANAVRHGLTAETVVGSLEDAEDYKAFEAAIISDYDAETAVARELVLRLASLLWRLRRANAIEADLFEIQAEALRERRLAADGTLGRAVYNWLSFYTLAPIFVPTICYAQPRALSRKVSDEFTVPLCRVHHRELHRQGDERAWWSKLNIDPMSIALRYWQHSRGISAIARSNPEPQDFSNRQIIRDPNRAGRRRDFADD